MSFFFFMVAILYVAKIISYYEIKRGNFPILLGKFPIFYGRNPLWVVRRLLQVLFLSGIRIASSLCGV